MKIRLNCLQVSRKLHNAATTAKGIDPRHDSAMEAQIIPHDARHARNHNCLGGSRSLAA